MNAIEFVRKFGIFGAKEYLSGSIFYKDNLVVFTSEDNLKQIVDAWELVESKGGIVKAKKEAACLHSNDFDGAAFRIYDAIHLVEQCQ